MVFTALLFLCANLIINGLTPKNAMAVPIENAKSWILMEVSKPAATAENKQPMAMLKAINEGVKISRIPNIRATMTQMCQVSKFMIKDLKLCNKVNEIKLF